MQKNISRHRFLSLLGMGTLGLALPGSVWSKGKTGPESLHFYAGTYTDGTASKGIYRCSFNPKNGAMSLLEATGDIVNPSFLSIAPNGHLYAVSETGSYKGQHGGAVYAYRIDPKSGKLHFINARPTHGAAPCHLSLGPGRQHLMVANYMDGNVAVFPLRTDGGLAPLSDLKQHHGTGPNKNRQEGPHAHCILPAPDGKHLLSADLGADKIYAYLPPDEKGKMPAADPAFYPVKPGSGPRHLVFHPRRNAVYVINELSSTITVFNYDPGSGRLEEMQSISTLPEGFTEHNQCAEIQLSADGQFLYGSNRGHDSIVVYRIDPQTGKLKTVQHQSTLGHWPRFFLLDPTGRFLLAANKESDSIVAFHVNRDSGRIRPADRQLSIPAPVCIQFYSGS